MGVFLLAAFFAGTPDRVCFLGCGFGVTRFAGMRPLAFVFPGAAFFGAGRLGDFLAMVGGYDASTSATCCGGGNADHTGCRYFAGRELIFAA